MDPIYPEEPSGLVQIIIVIAFAIFFFAVVAGYCH